MKLEKVILLCVLLWMAVCTASAQSPAALARLEQRYSVEQLADMAQNAHYKYIGLQLFYSSSFLVVENGSARAATEAEIAAIDLDQYQHLRQEETNVRVLDTEIGKEILLLSRAEFEGMVLGQYDAHDRAAYLAYKAEATAVSTPKSTN